MSGHNEWRMRKATGQTFGPVSLDTLRLWATDGRVAPEDEVREADGPWRRAGNVPDLGMDWLLELPGGELYGPVPLSAFLDMLREGAIGPDLKVRRRDDLDFSRLGDLAAKEAEEPEPAPEPKPPAVAAEPETAPAAIAQVEPLATGADAVTAPVPAEPSSPESAPPAAVPMGPVAPEPAAPSAVVSAPVLPPVSAAPESQAPAASAVSVPSAVVSEPPAVVGAAPVDPTALAGTETPPEAPPKPASRISPPDEARMLSELQSALGVGRRFRVFDRIRQGRSG